MKVNPFVFLVSAIGILAFVGLGAAFPEPAGLVFGAFQDTIVGSVGWFYVLVVTFFLLFAMWLFLSPFGNVRLGKDAGGGGGIGRVHLPGILEVQRGRRRGRGHGGRLRALAPGSPGSGSRDGIWS